MQLYVITEQKTCNTWTAISIASEFQSCSNVDDQVQSVCFLEMSILIKLSFFPPNIYYVWCLKLRYNIQVFQMGIQKSSLWQRLTSRARFTIPVLHSFHRSQRQKGPNHLVWHLVPRPLNESHYTSDRAWEEVEESKKGTYQNRANNKHHSQNGRELIIWYMSSWYQRTNYCICCRQGPK